jgi:hypothetical protein
MPQRRGPGLFDGLAFLFRKKLEIFRLHASFGEQEPLCYQSAFKQFANSRRTAWHSSDEAPIINGSQLVLGQPYLQTLAATQSHGGASIRNKTHEAAKVAKSAKSVFTHKPYFEPRTNADNIRAEECHRISLELAAMAEELADQWDAIELTMAGYLGNRSAAT